LQRPTVSIEPNTASKRPELLLFDLQKEQVELSTALLSKSNLPKLNAFAQGGFGNPGLNMLDNSFNPFYMAGLRLNWDVFDWKKNKSEIQALQVNKEIIDTQKETFELNNQLELVNLRSEIAEMEELISYDEAIIPLRDEMVKTAESQLKNGVITSSDFITEFTNLYEAKSNMTLHKTQLLLKQVQYRLTDGTYGKSDALN
jgi:outer membrane protein TolC